MLLPVYQRLWAAVDHANHVYFCILVAELSCISRVTYTY